MIEVRELTKHYGDLVAVDRIGFQIRRGEVVGFLGPNGAGKSTTMRMLVGCSAPDSGSVSIAGVRDPATARLGRARVGYLPENAPLYRAMRVDRYLDFAARILGLARSERRRAIARAANATGLDQHLVRPIDQLSKGYRQRVGLAQALLGEPDVLVLDEPTSGLDPGEIQRIRALVRQLGEERTVLLSTHVLSEVEELSSRVLILARGRLVADGPPAELARGESVELFVSVRAGAAVLDAVAKRLAAVPGVLALRAARSQPDGFGAWHAELGAAAESDRRAAAERVASEVAAAGAHLVELSHQVPTLERIFLRRTDPSWSKGNAVAEVAP